MILSSITNPTGRKRFCSRRCHLLTLPKAANARVRTHHQPPGQQPDRDKSAKLLQQQHRMMKLSGWRVHGRPWKDLSNIHSCRYRPVMVDDWTVYD